MCRLPAPRKQCGSWAEACGRIQRKLFTGRFRRSRTCSGIWHQPEPQNLANNPRKVCGRVRGSDSWSIMHLGSNGQRLGPTFKWNEWLMHLDSYQPAMNSRIHGLCVFLHCGSDAEAGRKVAEEFSGRIHCLWGKC